MSTGYLLETCECNVSPSPLKDDLTTFYCFQTDIVFIFSTYSPLASMMLIPNTPALRYTLPVTQNRSHPDHPGVAHL